MSPLPATRDSGVPGTGDKFLDGNVNNILHEGPL
jgi:hypothetical protein